MGSRNFCFTLNNYTDEEIEKLKKCTEDGKVKYIAFSREVGESGTPHLQGYLSWRTPQRLAACKKLNPRAHFERMRGSFLQNDIYITKQAELEEYGTKPKDPEDSGRAEIARWDAARANARAGEFDAIPSDLYIRYFGNFKRIRMEASRNDGNIDQLDNYWIWGRTGSGKSTLARQLAVNRYDKMVNKWWDNYAGEESVLIEDIGQDCAWLGDFLKIWADHYPFRCEVKGDTMMIRPKRIVCTSNYHPNSIFKQGDLEAIERRFKIKELN